jgi:2,3-dihydroxy-p-cumate/2,3-dihydroxybenzoate 3,4-dioxygenase
MVADIDDIGRATNRLRKHDVTIVYGPGRHPASGSIFLYFLDPDGTTLEYSFGMELFPDDGARDARTLPPLPESSDSWLGTPHPLMAKSGEVEAYQIA